MRLTQVDRASHTDEAQRIDAIRASCIPTHNVHNVLPVFRIVLSGALRIELLSCLMTTSALTRLLTQPHWPCECASPLSAPKTPCARRAAAAERVFGGAEPSSRGASNVLQRLKYRCSSRITLGFSHFLVSGRPNFQTRTHRPNQTTKC
jgi:hypothetical protein